MNMKGTYVECLNWTWQQKLTYIRACVGDEIPHEKLCGYGVSSRDDILGEYISAKYLYCCDKGMMSYDCETANSPTPGRKKVTLSDLKPRTKEEYEKVDFMDAWEPVKAYCDGEELYCGALNKVKCPEVALKLWVHGSLYRKVTKSIEWWEDAVEYANSIEGVAVVYIPESNSFDVNGVMTNDQLCDFARILLEQGE